MINLKRFNGHILVLAALFIGFLVGITTEYVANDHERKDNAVLFNVLSRNNPILPLKEYANIMNHSNGSVSDFINAYAQLERAKYCINVFTATTEYIPVDEYLKFVEVYDHTIDFARFMEIIKKLNSSNSISPDDLNFIKQQAKRFDKLPDPNTNIHSLKDYFYQVKNDFEKIR
jgi:hypothetical protein